MRLSALRGRIVALEWSNPICPFAGKDYSAGTTQALQHEEREAGGTWLTVFSDPPDVVGHDSDLEAEFVTEQRRSGASAVLLDHDTSLARSFGARHTPHTCQAAVEGLRLIDVGAGDLPDGAQSECHSRPPSKSLSRRIV